MDETNPTTVLRQKRILERRAAKELNNIGKRLSWLREKLNLTQVEIAQATDIPKASYNDREAGRRTDYIEEYVVLSAFFDSLWQKKYKSYHPMFDGNEVKKITPMWIQFGKDDMEKDHELIIKNFRAKMLELQNEAYQKEIELKRQLNMFDN